MMTKKVVGLLTAAIVVFAFAVSVQCAETNWPEPTNAGSYPYTTRQPGASENPDNIFQLNECQNCKCPVKNVPCPQTTTIVGEQGSTTTQVSPTCPFDYDDNYGYVAASGTGMGADRNCRVLFNVCYCPESCATDVGTKIGIQMTILTPGVYWAKDPNAYDDVRGWNTVWFDNYAHTGLCTPTDQPKNFGQIKYYQTLEEKFNEKGKFIRIPRNEGTPAGDGSTAMGAADTSGDCFTSIPAVNKVKVIESEIDTDYVITAADAKRCNFWIDIPAMRLDGTAKQGDAIQVRITMLWNRVVTGLCEDCNPPILCECIRTVGVVCPDKPVVDTEKGCVFFPYVFQGLDAGAASWQSGIAVSALNRDVLPANAYCELTVKDQEGNIATYKNTAMGNKLVWAFVLDQIIDNFTNASKLVPGAVSLEIKSNYRMDGYSFMMADMDGSYFGAGAMARGCEGCCP
jgi:hypothetical protein